MTASLNLCNNAAVRDLCENIMLTYRAMDIIDSYLRNTLLVETINYELENESPDFAFCSIDLNSEWRESRHAMRQNARKTQRARP